MENVGEAEPAARSVVYVDFSWLAQNQAAVSFRQVVAYNLARGRRVRDFTQEKLGEALSELTGTPWSQATVSAAENAWKGTGKIRHFDVDEIVAFALALKLPVAWFLEPPPIDPQGEAVADDQAWLTPSKRTGSGAPAISSDSLRTIAPSSPQGATWELKKQGATWELKKPSGAPNKAENMSGWPSPRAPQLDVYRLWAQTLRQILATLPAEEEPSSQ